MRRPLKDTRSSPTGTKPRSGSRLPSSKTHSRRLAAALLANCHRGDRAILFFPAGVDFLKGLFGCLRAGVIGVPVAYQRLRKAEPRSRLDRCRLAARPFDHDRRDHGGSREVSGPQSGLAGLRWMSVNDLVGWAGVGRENRSAHFEWRVRAGIAKFDRGEVAFPPVHLGQHRLAQGSLPDASGPLHNLRRMQELLHLLPEDCVGVSWLPAYHDMGLIGHILQAVHTGADLVLMSPMAFVQKPLRWLSAISRYRATITCGPNFAFELCTRQIKPRDCEGLDSAILAGCLRWRGADLVASPRRVYEGVRAVWVSS